MKVQFSVSNRNKFKNEVEKALFPKNTKITVGVANRMHYTSATRRDKKGHSKAGSEISDSMLNVAALHEFGGFAPIEERGRYKIYKIPKRSFIRMPVRKFLKRDIGEILHSYKRIDFMMKAICRRIYERIQEAFDTNGWGEWAELSERYKKISGRRDPALTDTGQLRGSVFVEYNGKTIAGKNISGGVKPKRADFGRMRK